MMGRRRTLVGAGVLTLAALSGVSTSGADPSPDPVTPGIFSLATVGDIGTTPQAVRVLEGIRAAGPDLFLALGDLAYSSASEQEWCDLVTRTVGPDVPVSIIAGNHEEDWELQGRPSEFARCLPDRMGATDRYPFQYTFDVGTLARFIMISPDLTFDGEHFYYGEDNSNIRWVADAIDDARATGIAWVVVGMHKPCLSKGAYYCDVYQDLWTLLVDRRVDLVLSAHDHSYQRTAQVATSAACPLAPIEGFDPTCVTDDGRDGRYPKGGGVVSVIAATGGQALYEIAETDAEAPWIATAMGLNEQPGWGFLHLEITPDRLSGRFVNTEPVPGYTDAFSIERGG